MSGPSRLSPLRLVSAMLALAVTAVFAAEQLPEKPARFFNDYTGEVDRDVGDGLNERLAKYERESSNQLLVVFYPRMLTDSSIEDYCTRAFEKWGVGRADRDNGAVLFVFNEEHKMRIQTGYGLEASLTDAECFRIIEGMKPLFRAGDYTGAATFAASAMIEATAGEYQGSGKTLAEDEGDPQWWIMIAFVTVILLIKGFRFYDQNRGRGYSYDSKGRRSVQADQPWYNRSWSSSGSWSSDGGGSGGGSSGGSSFSGGGGSTGGGGASGGW